MIDALGSGSKLASYDLSKTGATHDGANLTPFTDSAAWSATWPAPGATLDLDFANDRGFVRGIGQGRSMDAVTFTRASSGSYVGSDGTLKGNGNALGLNLLSSAQELNSSPWLVLGSGGASVLPDVEIAPDGTKTADKIVVGTGTGSWYVACYQNVGIVSGQPQTFSVYLKAGELNYAFIRPHNNTSNFGASGLIVNLITGDITYPAGGLTPSSTGSASYIGNGWWRVSVTSTPDATLSSTTGGPGIWPTNTNNFNNNGGPGPADFAGNGSSGIYAWGAQLEIGSSSTTYYPTNVNMPRFDWSNNTPIPINQFINTADFSPSTSAWQGWTQNNGTLTQILNSSPDNTTSCLWIVNSNTTICGSNSTQGTIYISPQYSYWPLANKVLSIYVKSFGNRYFCIADQALSRAWFDLTTLSTQSSWSVSYPTPPISSIEDVGNGWVRCSVAFPSNANPSNTGFGFFSSSAITNYPVADGVNGVYLYGPQLENGSTPTPYQQIGQATFCIPLRASTTCNGILREDSSINYALWCRDATKTPWVGDGLIITKDQTGIDGITNAASSLVANNANATLIQTTTRAIGYKAVSVYLKSLAGSTKIQISADNSSWSTVTLSSTEWRRIVLINYFANPCIAIKLLNNGDSVAMDYAQIEEKTFCTSPIYTGASFVTRASETVTISGAPFNGFYNKNEGTALIKSINYYNFVPSGHNGSGFGFYRAGFFNGGWSATHGRDRHVYSYRNIGAVLMDDRGNWLSTGVAPYLITDGSTFYVASVSVKSSLISVTGLTQSLSTTAGTFTGMPNCIGLVIGNDYNYSAYGLFGGCVNRIIYFPKYYPESPLLNLSGQSA